MRSAFAPAFAFLAVLLAATAHAQPYGDWRSDAPGGMHRITPAEMPAPYATHSVADAPSVISPPAGAQPQVPAGFSVQRFASGLREPRVIRVAANGDIFVAESAAGRIDVLRSADGAAQPQRKEVFASGLDRPFGIAFYPPGPDPRFVYVAENNAVLRYPYRSGDLRARGGGETVVAQLSPTSRYHWTRDLAFSADGTRLFVSVGSNSNDGNDMPRLSADAIRRQDAEFGLGAAWGPEQFRADLLSFTPDGRDRRVFATGLRNCAGLALSPQGDLWCATNERDGLGDNLPPDFSTRVREGEFFGWPWYYIGSHADPTHADQRPDLAGHVTVPDVLIQPHSAPLGMTFYEGSGVAAFPPEYRGDAFVALHGSWNRSLRTGYKVVRIHFVGGVPEGRYQDFLTGFVTGNGLVWGRPVDVAVAHDGALLVTEDGNDTIWRVAHGGGSEP